MHLLAGDMHHDRKRLSQEQNGKTTISGQTRASRSGFNTQPTSPVFQFSCMVLLYFADLITETLLISMPCFQFFLVH